MRIREQYQVRFLKTTSIKDRHLKRSSICMTASVSILVNRIVLSM